MVDALSCAVDTQNINQGGLLMYFSVMWILKYQSREFLSLNQNLDPEFVT
jgi:hypothetical protein